MVLLPRGKGIGPPRKKAPQRVQSGQDYGDRKASMEMQRAIPTTDRPAQAMADARASGEAQASAPPQLAAAEAMAVPRGTLAGPTRRPGEPPTAGLLTGPGPGPSSTPPISRPQVSSDTLLLGRYLPAFETIANSGQTSQAYRQFVRRLRSQMPTNHVRETVMQQAAAQQQGGGMGGGGLPSMPPGGGGVTQQSPGPPTPSSSPTSAPATPGPSPQPGSPGY